MSTSPNDPSLQLPTSEQVTENGTVAVTDTSYTDSFAQINPGSLYLGINDAFGSLYGFYPSGSGVVAAGGSGTDNIVFVGSFADVQSILNSLNYVAGGTTSSDSIHYDIWNQAGVETTGSVPVTVLAPDPAATTWTGAVSSDWNTPANWSGGAVPASGDSVTLPGGTPNAPTLSNATLNGEAITLAGATVDWNDVLLNSAINGSGTVQVGGTLTVGTSGSVDATQLAITGTAETVINNGVLTAPGGTLNLTNGAGSSPAAATFINNGTLAAQDLNLKSAPQSPNGTPDPFAGGPDWTLMNAGTIVIPGGGSFDLNGTVQGGVIAFAGAGTLALEQSMAFAAGAVVSGFGAGDQIDLLDPQAGNDDGQLAVVGGNLQIVAGGTVIQAIPISGSIGLGNFELENEAGPNGVGIISYEPNTPNNAVIVAPTSASATQGETLALNNVAIAPSAPSADYDTITVSAGTGTLFMNGASGSGSNQVTLSNLTGQQANADLASLQYVPGPGSSSDTVTLTVIPPAPVEFSRSIPISVSADPPTVVIAASDAYPVELVSNTVISTTAGNHMIFIGGTGDTLTATGGTETVQAFQGNNVITTGAGNDSINYAGSGNTINAGGGSNTLEDSGANNTIIMPLAGQGFDDVFGYVLQNGDMLDFRQALAATTWNGTAATLGNYLHIGNTGGDAIISLSTSGGGAASQIADLRDAGQLNLAGVLSHALT